MLEVTPELASVVRQHEHLVVASWGNWFFHIVELGLPPRAVCGAAKGPRLVDYTCRPKGPRARVPYLCKACYQAFMGSLSGGLRCPRGHGAMVPETYGDEFFCLFCSERRYPSPCGHWVPASKIKRTRERKKAKDASGDDSATQPRLFDITDTLGREDEMKARIIQSTDGTKRGTFLIGLFDDEWLEPAVKGGDVEAQPPLLRSEGWSPLAFLFQDLGKPGNGSIFHHYAGRNARSDVEDRGLKVGALYVETLQWLYGQKIDDLDALPEMIQLGPESRP